MSKASDLLLKEEGNALFQRRYFSEAISKYSQGLEVLEAGLAVTGALALVADCRRKAVLLSNRSSCHFEKGDYANSALDAQACLDLIAKFSSQNCSEQDSANDP